MKTIKQIDFKLIEINFEYKEQIITIKCEPFRTIDYIKEKAKNKIMDLPDNIHFYYLGRDINENGSEKIGNFFKNREKVTIKLIIPEINHHLNCNSPNKIYNYKYIFNNNSFRYKEKNEEKIYKNLGKFNKSQNDIKIVKLIQNKKRKIDSINNFSLYKNKSETKLPTLNNININENSKKNIIISNKIKNKIGSSNDKELSCNCGRHNISEYCRNCKKYICLECRADQKHKNHLTIKLNMHNIESTVKLYGKLIQDDIQKKIETNRNIFHNDDLPDENILITRKERIIKKYQEVINKYEKIMSKVDNHIKSEDKERTTLVINAYNELSQKMNKQLLELLDKLNNNYILPGQKVVFNDLRSFFDDINSKEETLSFLGKDIIKYHLKHEINTKLKSSLDKIDRTLDELNNDKIPFNLNNKYYEELIKMDIIKHHKENKDFNNNNNGDLSEFNSKSYRNEDKDNINDNNKIGQSKFAPKNEIIPDKV